MTVLPLTDARIRNDVGTSRHSGSLARLRTALSGLGPSERRVAEVLLARRDEVVDWSTAEVARAAGRHLRLW